MYEPKTRVLGVVGFHNSGKTTLIETLVKNLTQEGLRVGYIKHDPKGHGETDKKGSDTDRIFGLSPRVLLISPDRATLWDRKSYDPLEAVSEFFKGFDLVIVEGFKSSKEIPKVALGEVPAENVIFRLDEKPEDLEELLEFLRKFIKG